MKFFCRECGKEIKSEPILLNDTDKEALLFFKFRTGQNACVCAACWEAYAKNGQKDFATVSKEIKQ